MRNRITILLLTILTCGLKSYGQDPQFTQFYSNPLYQAPSFAGATSGYRVGINYRDQWAKMPGLLRTFNVYADANVDKINSGIGLIALRDVAGSANYSNTYVGLMYTYNIRFSRRIYLRPGLGFYYSEHSLDYEKLVFASQLYSESNVQPVLAEDFANVRNYDWSASMLLSMRNSWIGICLDHLNHPNVSVTSYDYNYPAKFTIFGGLRLHKLERLISTKRQTVTIAANYRHQGYTDQMDVGLYWSYAPIVLGVWYRDLPLIKDYSRRDAISVLIGYNYKEVVNIGYSYDFTVSRLVTSTGGAHEISLSYKFEIERKHKFKAIPCPEF